MVKPTPESPAALEMVGWGRFPPNCPFRGHRLQDFSCLPKLFGPHLSGTTMETASPRLAPVLATPKRPPSPPEGHAPHPMTP
jgi:hypothetical protein